MNTNAVLAGKTKEGLKFYPDMKTRAGIIEQYLKQIRNALRELCSSSIDEIEEFSRVLVRARARHNEIMFFGTGQDYHIINHANFNFLKTNNLSVITMGIPEITAFRNEGPCPYRLKDILERRHFGKRDVLVGVQFEKDDRILRKAFEYNYENGGINVLISNMKRIPEYTGINIFINSDNTLVARDTAQIVLHFLSANLAFKTDTEFKDQGAEVLSEYCQLLLRSLKGRYFSNKNLAGISAVIEKKLREGRRIFAFGNGGSASIASFAADALKELADDPADGYARIFDVTSYVKNMTRSINNGYISGYLKSDAFTRIIRNLGVRNGDLLLGFSSSGNSENILHPFVSLDKTVRIGILGFENGGVIGSSNVADSMAVVQDAGGFRSYQRAQDGQRIAVSAIINTLYDMGRFTA